MTVATLIRSSSSVREHGRYILRRVADCFVRENYRDMALGEIVAADAVPFGHLVARADHYLIFDTSAESRLFLPVEADGFMQVWRVLTPPFILTDKRGMTLIDSITEFLEVMSAGIDGEELDNLTAFLGECQAAVEQGVICNAARVEPAPATQEVAHHPIWHQSMLANDRLASFLDHPFYPTARAKHGFTTDDLIAFGPEHQSTFRLNWLALPRESLSVQGGVPDIWPSFEEVGLDPALERTHALLPVHPYMVGERLEAIIAEAGLEAHAHMAPRAWLEVTPTLSVRAMAVVGEPGLHIKLPLAISTLGRLNLRAIKSVTINDGHVAHALLEEIRSNDPVLARRLLLTDESSGAHHAGNRFLAYILRRYPDELAGSEPVPVAALMAPMPDGRPYALHLVDRHYAGDVHRFIDHFCDLLLGVHLRLAARYGIELEANQQNSILLFDTARSGLRLLLKDNDSPRIDAKTLRDAFPASAGWIAQFQDERITSGDGIAQMLITITIQLNLGAIVEGLGRHLNRTQEFRRTFRRAVDRELDALESEGIAVDALRAALLQATHFPIKYLLRAATLEPRKAMGAADVNKAYGYSAPNFLLTDAGR